MESTFPFAFNIKAMRPACVNLQAIYGGTPQLVQEFPTCCWQLSPSDDIKVYPVTLDQIQILIKRSVAKHGNVG